MPTPETPFESLSDPNPPPAGRAARDAVRGRAGQLQRRRRVVQVTSALACTAVLAVGVAALVSTGSASDGGRGSVGVAAAPEPAQPATAASTEPTDASTSAPPATSPVTPTLAPAEVAPTDVAPTAVATVGSVTITITGLPAGVALDVQLVGDGSYAATASASTVEFRDIPPGNYEVRWQWSSDDGAAAAGHRSVTVVAGDNPFTF